ALPPRETRVEGITGEPYRGFVVPAELAQRTMSKRRQTACEIAALTTMSVIAVLVGLVYLREVSVLDRDLVHAAIVTVAIIGAAAFIVDEVVSSPVGDALLDPATRVPELLRLGMVASGVVFLVAIARWPSETWIPLALLTWGLAIAADLVEH